MSRNAKSRRYKQRHGTVRSTIICRQCFGHIERFVKSLPPLKFESKALRSLRDNVS